MAAHSPASTCIASVDRVAAARVPVVLGPSPSEPPPEVNQHQRWPKQSGFGYSPTTGWASLGTLGGGGSDARALRAWSRNAAKR